MIFRKLKRNQAREVSNLNDRLNSTKTNRKCDEAALENDYYGGEVAAQTLSNLLKAQVEAKETKVNVQERGMDDFDTGIKRNFQSESY